MTKRLSWLSIVVISLALMVPLAAVFYFAEQAFGTPFPGFDLMDFLIRTLPGDIVTFGIDTMTNIILELNIGRVDRAAKMSEQTMAVLQFVGLGVVAGIVYGAAVGWMRRTQKFLPSGWSTGLLLGWLVGIPMAVISAQYNTSATTSTFTNVVWITLAFLGWGLGHNYIYRKIFTDFSAATPQAEEEPALTDAGRPLSEFAVLDRRQFLVRVGGTAATITVLGAGLGALLQNQDDEAIEGGNVVDSQQLSSGLEPAPGTRSEYTPLEDHYRIDINSGRPPNITAEDYVLTIGGLVDSPLELTLDDIRNNYESMDQFITLSCISNRIAGRLISTTRWTGVPMQDILKDLDIQDSGTHIRITSFDGFDEVVAIDTIMDDRRVMLTYEWDGVSLPGKHGFPLRIYIPDHYGMKQPKWIEKMEVIDEWEEGYWVRRGWSATAIVKMTSVIDTVAVDEAYQQDGKTFIPMGGIAYSGAKGISKVEVQIDDGEWLEAELREPLSELTWVIWRYDWELQEGEHTFRVRTYDEEGNQQIAESSSQRPDGATGIHEITERV